MDAGAAGTEERRRLTVIAPFTGGQLTPMLWRLVDLVRFVAEFGDSQRRVGIAEQVRRMRDGRRQSTFSGICPEVLASGAGWRALQILAGALAWHDQPTPRAVPVDVSGSERIAFVSCDIDRDVAGQLCQVFELLTRAYVCSRPGYVAGALRACPDGQRLGDLLEVAGRLRAALSEEWTAAACSLAARLRDAGPGPFLLEREDLDTYDFIARRLVASWHGGDTLEQILYGVGEG